MKGASISSEMEKGCRVGLGTGWMRCLGNRKRSSVCTRIRAFCVVLPSFSKFFFFFLKIKKIIDITRDMDYGP